ncbi:hypothetical protein RI844_10200 [Thalassotalea fonticola]|uniref:Uncharacterized protein n=1 Tax=Thalassotalea fonticola TaxID=3065649 RepID=A0ABZ0GIJ5_9GAMM|nr:hypothetical protein RI844_10200 [Colwelliaceae bacterium S1-1]
MKMNNKFLTTTVIAGILAVSGCTSLTETGPVSVADWHNTNDDYAGLKPSTFADDLFLAVSKSGVYNKASTYEMLPGYHWATFAELEARLTDWKKENGSSDLGEYNYYDLGGWEKYQFDGVQRRDFIFADTAKNNRVVYAGISESKVTVHKSSWDENYSNAEKSSVKNWAGFVLIKD